MDDVLRSCSRRSAVSYLKFVSIFARYPLHTPQGRPAGRPHICNGHDDPVRSSSCRIRLGSAQCVLRQAQDEGLSLCQ